MDSRWRRRGVSPATVGKISSHSWIRKRCERFQRWSRVKTPTPFFMNRSGPRSTHLMAGDNPPPSLSQRVATVSATIALGGKPEFAVADAQSGRVFCNIEDKNELIAIDTKTHSVIAH